MLEGRCRPLSPFGLVLFEESTLARRKSAVVHGAPAQRCVRHAVGSRARMAEAQTASLRPHWWRRSHNTVIPEQQTRVLRRIRPVRSVQGSSSSTEPVARSLLLELASFSSQAASNTCVDELPREYASISREHARPTMGARLEFQKGYFSLAHAGFSPSAEPEVG